MAIYQDYLGLLDTPECRIEYRVNCLMAASGEGPLFPKESSSILVFLENSAFFAPDILVAKKYKWSLVRKAMQERLERDFSYYT